MSKTANFSCFLKPFSSLPGSQTLLCGFFSSSIAITSLRIITRRVDVRKLVQNIVDLHAAPPHRYLQPKSFPLFFKLFSPVVKFFEICVAERSNASVINFAGATLPMSADRRCWWRRKATNILVRLFPGVHQKLMKSQDEVHFANLLISPTFSFQKFFAQNTRRFIPLRFASARVNFVSAPLFL